VKDFAVTTTYDAEAKMLRTRITRDVAIWWLSQHNMQAIEANGGLGDDLPSWLKTEFRSLYGRNGRGRLWVSEAFDVNGESTISAIQFPEPPTFLSAYLSEHCGGIVIAETLASQLIGMPGVITDLRLRRWMCG
jgi:hypothetical protein